MIPTVGGMDKGMRQEVKIRIQGLQAQGVEQNEPVEVVSVGQMYTKDGFTCVTYDEVVSEEENGLVQVAKNLLKVKDRQVEVVKKGAAATHMVFIPEQTTVTYYSTPFGELEVGIHTSRIEKIDREDGFSLRMDYELEMNQTFVSSCGLDITVEQ